MITKLLIENVKKYQILYNSSHEDYKNARKKDRIWELIAIELQITVYDAKKKWKNIKDSYCKYLKCLNSATNKSKKNYLHWQWATYMEPLKPFLFNTKNQIYHIEMPDLIEPLDETIDNLKTEDSLEPNPLAEIDEIDIEGSSLNLTIPLSSITESSSWVSELVELEPRKRKFDHVDPDEDVFSIDGLNGYTENSSQRRRELEDMCPIHIIFLGYSKLISTFSKKRQAITKLKVAQIIMEQEILNEEELVSSNNPLIRAPSPANQFPASSTTANYT